MADAAPTVELETRAVDVRHNLESALESLGSVIVGQKTVLEDYPGLAKTLIARSFAQVAEMKFTRIQFTPDLMPSDVTGSSVYDQRTGDFRFHEGPVFTNLLLADEINRAPPKTQAALLEAMQERQVTVDGTTHVLEPPFLVLATQNPIEMEGTYPLPEAQLDRFLFKLLVPFPSDAELAQIAERTTGTETSIPQRVLDGETLLEAGKLARTVLVAPHVMEHAVRLVSATHPERTTTADVRRFVRHGSSPRGLQSLVLAAKVIALRAGRWNVAFGDIDRAAHPALRHRMILQFEAVSEGVTQDTLIDQILRDVRRD